MVIICFYLLFGFLRKACLHWRIFISDIQASVLVGSNPAGDSGGDSDKGISFRSFSGIRLGSAPIIFVSFPEKREKHPYKFMVRIQ